MESSLILESFINRRTRHIGCSSSFAKIGVICTLEFGLLVLISACGSSDKEAMGSSSTLASLPVTKAWFGPLDSLIYLGMSEQDRHNEEQQVIGDCMNDLGFDYWAEHFRSNTPEITINDTYAGYGLALELEGSDNNDSSLRESPNNPNNDYFENLAPAERGRYILALEGPPDITFTDDAGCSGKAFAATRTDRTTRELIGQLQEETRKRLLASREYIQIQEEQSRCWADLGFDGRPSELAFEMFEDMAKRQPQLKQTDIEKLRSYEIAASEAEKTCIKAGDEELLRTVREAIEYNLIEDYPGLLELLENRSPTGR